MRGEREDTGANHHPALGLSSSAYIVLRNRATFGQFQLWDPELYVHTIQKGSGSGILIYVVIILHYRYKAPALGSSVLVTRLRHWDPQFSLQGSGTGILSYCYKAPALGSSVLITRLQLWDSG